MPVRIILNRNDDIEITIDELMERYMQGAHFVYYRTKPKGYLRILTCLQTVSDTKTSYGFIDPTACCYPTHKSWSLAGAIESALNNQKEIFLTEPSNLQVIE